MDNYPSNIEAPQRVYIQYSHDIVFDYTTGRFPTGNEITFDWEDIYIPIDHYLNNVLVGPHVFMRMKIGIDGLWGLPIRMNNLYIVDTVVLDLVIYDPITLISTYKFIFTLEDGRTVTTDTFEIKDVAVTQQDMEVALTSYLTSSLTTGQVVETTTSGLNIVLTSAAKKTAYNKDFGVTHTTVAYGDHTHSSLTNYYTKTATDALLALKSPTTHIQAVNYGGTNLTSYTIGDLIYASGPTTLAKRADVAIGNVLLSGGIGIAPIYGKVDLTTHITGILPTANLKYGITPGDILPISTEPPGRGSILFYNEDQGEEGVVFIPLISIGLGGTGTTTPLTTIKTTTLLGTWTGTIWYSKNFMGLVTITGSVSSPSGSIAVFQLPSGYIPAKAVAILNVNNTTSDIVGSFISDVGIITSVPNGEIQTFSVSYLEASKTV